MAEIEVTNGLLNEFERAPSTATPQEVYALVMEIRRLYAGHTDNVASFDKAYLEWNAELETVRGERDALKAALEAVRDQAVSAQQDWELASPIYARAIVRIAEAVLNTPTAAAPQAWTPRLNEKVRINEDSRVGTVIRIMGELGFPYGVAWGSTDRISEWYALEDLSRYED